jgi:hypothetical protein
MKDIKLYHRFIDEAGDTTFFLKGKKPAIGSRGVSNVFILGMVKINDSIEEVRNKIIHLQNKIAIDPFFDVPSVNKKKEKMGYFLHATDDLPEIRKEFFDLIKTIDCSFEAIVGRKDINRFIISHESREEYFYADLLSHLLKNQLINYDKIVLNVSERGQSTKHTNLNLALKKAEQMFCNHNIEDKKKTRIKFEVQVPTKEPLLNLADYMCWAIQRFFEKGEIRYYNFIKEKINLVIDLYDYENSEGFKNYYDNKKNPLSTLKK